MVEIDLDFEPEAVRIRPQFAEGIALGDADRLENLDDSGAARTA